MRICAFNIQETKRDRQRENEKTNVIFPLGNTRQTWLIVFCLISKVILKQKGQGDNSHLFCYEHNEIKRVLV